MKLTIKGYNWIRIYFTEEEKHVDHFFILVSNGLTNTKCFTLVNWNGRISILIKEFIVVTSVIRTDEQYIL